ncbi:MAG: alpha-amylase family glycosyl hydrolase [Phycisphaerales bacterium]|nr:alpha-amylase family glycosyl hydrolase [Phycisphaerales bacterium]
MLLTIAILVLAGQADIPSTWPPPVPKARSTHLSATQLPDSISGKQDADGNWQLDFRFRPANPLPPGSRVAIAGNFNHWSTTSQPMVQLRKGTWHARMTLADGTYWYKFVINGDTWLSDPGNPVSDPDGYGGVNSIIRLGSVANLDAGRARLGDGHIDASGLAHDPAEPRYLQRRDPQTWRIRFRTLAHDVQKVSVVRPGAPPVAMAAILGNDRDQWWEAVVPDTGEAVPYTFIIQDGKTQERHQDIHTMSDSEQINFTTPEWARDAIWYQVMIDRFRNGNASNNPDPIRPWNSAWYEGSPWEGADGQTFYEYYVFARRYGGDIQGLLEKLDYLSDLGVNALYLNPVFEADSPHKYNATSYIHIDQAFGHGSDYAQAEEQEDLLDPSTWTWNESDRLFLDFLKEAHARGFKVIIDGVFNHVGVDHPAFRDVLENGEDSRFTDWFSVTSWEPFEYDCWGGFKSLPVFRKNDEHGIASEEVRNHIMQVTTRWMDPDGDGDPSDGIDGWRLDVPNEVPLPFWIEWRKHVKSINPDAYITGEIWTRAEEWLDGRSFDAVMNYPFAENTLAWIGNREAKITPTELDRRLAELRLTYPEPATNVLQNLLDSHDTDRFVSKIHNPDRPYDQGNREQQDASYDGSKPPEDAYRRARLAAFVQFTYLGAPMIYYGDEVGMWGSDDPNNRKPMPWQDHGPYADDGFEFMPEHLDFYRRVIALRNESAALRRGEFRTIQVHDDNDTWAFVRTLDDEEILVAINASDREAAFDMPDIGNGWTRVFSEPADADAGDPPRITLPPLGAAAWRRHP